MADVKKEARQLSQHDIQPASPYFARLPGSPPRQKREIRNSQPRFHRHSNRLSITLGTIRQIMLIDHQVFQSKVKCNLLTLPFFPMLLLVLVVYQVNTAPEVSRPFRCLSTVRPNNGLVSMLIKVLANLHRVTPYGKHVCRRL